MYEKTMTDPMKAELTSVGIKDLADAVTVDTFMNDIKKERSAVVLVNSVCGCAAGSARPGIIKSLSHTTAPSQTATVFAGVDTEATNKAREYFVGYSPSSPSIGFFRDGELVYMLERQQIEVCDAETLSQVITSVYDKFFKEEIDETAEIFDPNFVEEIDVQSLKKELDSGSITLLDCRSEGEREIATILPSVLVDQSLAEKIVGEWEKDKRIAIYCHHGQRSRQAVQFFKQHKFSQLLSVTGGIDAWSKEIDSSVKQY